jgi:hypothetical protein
MINTITNNVTQCSPRQCFEEISTGQSMPDTEGGADAYSACRCSDLFLPATFLPPLFSMTSFVEDEIGKNVPADERFREKFLEIRDRYRGAYASRHYIGQAGTVEGYEWAARELKDKVITPMLAALKDSPGSAALMNDISIAIAAYADIAAQAGAYEYSAEAWWAASRYLLDPAKARYNELVRDAGAGEIDSVQLFHGDRLPPEGEPLNVLDVERYNGLLREMLKTMLDSAMERQNGLEYLDVARSRVQKAIDELTRLGFKEEASEIKEDRLHEIGVERRVLVWLHANDLGWFGRSRDEKITRFYGIRDAVYKALKDEDFRRNYLVFGDAGEAVSPAGISFLEIRRLEGEIDALKGGKSELERDQLPRRYLELATIYHNVGEHDKAALLAEEAIREWRDIAIKNAGFIAGDYADMNARNAFNILQRFKESHRRRLVWELEPIKALHATGIREAEPPEGTKRDGREGKRPVK